MFKRITLFLLTNILVVITISIVLNLLGVGHYITRSGLDYKALMIFCLVWGFAGSFISLALSRIMAKYAMGVRVLQPNNSVGTEGWLVQTVHQLARSANLPAMPEVGVFDSPAPNAFATGPTKSRSLVAVSTGLLQTMNQEEIKAVLAHEVAHIQNGDMVTMVLLQGVVNAFVMFISRIIAFAVSQNVKEENRGMVNMLVVIVCEIVIGILGVMVVAWFSRQREFRADKGSAQLAGTSGMISALKNLKRLEAPMAAIVQGRAAHSLDTLQISGRKSGFLHLMSTHPPLEERIARLEARA